MSNLAMALHVMDELDYYLDKCDNYWVIETNKKQFWFNEDGSYYGTITKIPFKGEWL